MLNKFKHRSHDLERLDTGDYTTEEYERWQREMWFIHRCFGEIRALRKTIGPEIKYASGKLSILDIGAGDGSLLEEISSWRPGGLFLAGVELNENAAKSMKEKGFAAVCSNGLRLPFFDGAFDYAMCSLFTHHLSDDAVINLLREMSRVAQRKILVIDLHRNAIPYYFYRLAAKALLQRFSREDGALSILRGFTPSELNYLAANAGLKNISVKRSAAYRLVLTAGKRSGRSV